MDTSNQFLTNVLSELGHLTNRECYEGIKKIILDSREKEIADVGMAVNSQKSRQISEISEKYRQYLEFLDKLYFGAKKS